MTNPHVPHQLFMRDNQTAFDIVVAHLRQQDGRATRTCDSSELDDPSMCVYKAADGRMCAVGVLLDRVGTYHPDMEQDSAVGLMQDHKDMDEDDLDRPINHRYMHASDEGKAKYHDTFDLLGHLSQDLMSEMQNTHDNVAVEDWQAAFKQTANNHSLTLLKQ